MSSIPPTGEPLTCCFLQTESGNDYVRKWCSIWRESSTPRWKRDSYLWKWSWLLQIPDLWWTQPSVSYVTGVRECRDALGDRAGTVRAGALMLIVLIPPSDRRACQTAGRLRVWSHRRWGMWPWNRYGCSVNSNAAALVRLTADLLLSTREGVKHRPNDYDSTVCLSRFLNDVGYLTFPLEKQATSLYLFQLSLFVCFCVYPDYPALHAASQLLFKSVFIMVTNIDHRGEARPSFWTGGDAESRWRSFTAAALQSLER